MANLLLVEDNADLAYGLRNNLEIDGHAVDTVETGEAALERVRHRAPDLIVLDLMLPNLDGYQVLRRLRADGHEMPVLILTARTQEADKVLGFRLGADDYVTKPFGVLEVLARIGALLRRANRYASLKADRAVRRHRSQSRYAHRLAWLAGRSMCRRWNLRC